MKNRIILLGLVFILVTLSGCKKEYEFDTEDLKENPELQSRLYSLIITNDELMENLMQEIAQRPEAMQKMMMNQSLMQDMFSQENMEILQASEPITMDMMMEHMQQARGTEGMMQDDMMPD